MNDYLLLAVSIYAFQMLMVSLYVDLARTRCSDNIIGEWVFISQNYLLSNPMSNIRLDTVPSYITVDVLAIQQVQDEAVLWARKRRTSTPAPFSAYVFRTALEMTLQWLQSAF